VYTIVDDEPAVDAPGTLPVVTTAEPDTSNVCC
jgi:hypothetical protein